MIRILESISDKQGKLVINVRDSEGQLKDLVDYIKNISSFGHTFEVVVDPDNKDYEKRFEIDGDGSFKIYEVEFEKTEEVQKKEESLRTIDTFKKENELTDEMIDTLKEFYKSEWNNYFKDLEFVDWLYKIKNYENGTIYSEILEDYVDMLDECSIKKESLTKSNEISEALHDMYMAMEHVLDLWDESNNREYLDNSKYPFDKSYDELLVDIAGWIRAARNIELNGSEE